MEADEIKRVIEEASNNNWIPISIVIAIFGIVIALLLYIWKTSQEEMKNRHAKAEDNIDKLTESQRSISMVLTKLETIVEYHEKSINELHKHNAKA
jgi:F0F1-type ATP synthase membrane subunit b/b'